MSKRAVIVAAGVFASVAALTVSSWVGADEPAGPEPVFRHGLEVRVRKAGEKDFTAATKKIGLEFFLDGPNGNGVYIADAGDIAALPAKLVGPAPAKVLPPQWSHAMELQARKADEKAFALRPRNTASRWSATTTPPPIFTSTISAPSPRSPPP